MTPLGLPTSVTDLVERVAERLKAEGPWGYRLAQIGRDQLRAAFRLGDEEGVHLSLLMAAEVLSVALIVEGHAAVGYLRRALTRDKGRFFGWLDCLTDYSLGVYTRELGGARKSQYVPVARLSLQYTGPIHDPQHHALEYVLNVVGALQMPRLQIERQLSGEEVRRMAQPVVEEWVLEALEPLRELGMFIVQSEDAEGDRGQS